MRIAYFLEIDPYKNSGIVKKINDQVTYWKNENHQVQVFLIWPSDNSSGNVFLEGKHFYKKWINKILPDNFIKTYLTKVFCINKVRKAILSFNPDVLYFRQGLWYPGLRSILRSHKAVMELNTVDTYEKKFYSLLRRSMYSFGKPIILKETNGQVSVSPAIIDHYNYLDIPKKVVSNGINLTNSHTKKVVSDKDVTTAIFVGSSGMEWHGLDRIFKLAQHFKEIQFKLVGYEQSDFPEMNYDNLHFTGWLDHNSLIEHYKDSHFAIGSFGNHLVGKPVDSTLKVREYLAYGLPVLLGHHDTDFIDASFVFKCTDSNHKLLPFADIKQWIDKHKNTVITNEQIAHIDSTQKEKERLSFFKEVMNS